MKYLPLEEKLKMLNIVLPEYKPLFDNISETCSAGMQSIEDEYYDKWLNIIRGKPVFIQAGKGGKGYKISAEEIEIPADQNRIIIGHD